MKLSNLLLAVCISTSSTIALSEELSVVGTGDGVTVLQALGAAFEAIREFRAGDVFWSDAQTHVGENIGELPTHVLMIEMK